MTKSAAAEYIAGRVVVTALVPDTPVEAAPGTYALILRCRARVTLVVGALGEIAFRRGHYLYVGSAFGPGGVLARARRHVRSAKRRRWHLDYLAPALEPVELWYCHDGERREHRWARALHADPRLDAAAPRFGASDCRCPSHLLFARDVPDLAAVRRQLSGRVERVGADVLRGSGSGR